MGIKECKKYFDKREKEYDYKKALGEIRIIEINKKIKYAHARIEKGEENCSRKNAM